MHALSKFIDALPAEDQFFPRKYCRPKSGVCKPKIGFHPRVFTLEQNGDVLKLCRTSKGRYTQHIAFVVAEMSVCTTYCNQVGFVVL